MLFPVVSHLAREFEAQLVSILRNRDRQFSGTLKVARRN